MKIFEISLPMCIKYYRCDIWIFPCMFFLFCFSSVVSKTLLFFYTCRTCVNWHTQSFGKTFSQSSIRGCQWFSSPKQYTFYYFFITEHPPSLRPFPSSLPSTRPPPHPPLLFSSCATSSPADRRHLIQVYYRLHLPTPIRVTTGNPYL